VVLRSYYPNNLFAVELKQYPEASYIRMEMLNSIYNTRVLPNTHEFLRKHLPSILRSRCFNKHNYPFTKEVRATQIAHLFEHMILEYLSTSKRRRGVENHIHNGVTRWDWSVDKLGVFHIDIDSKKEDRELLLIALEKSVVLVSALMRTNLQIKQTA
jgi:hypothetical protein